MSPRDVLISARPALGLQVCITVHGFWCGFRELNTGLHACITSTLRSELSPQPFLLSILDKICYDYYLPLKLITQLGIRVWQHTDRTEENFRELGSLLPLYGSGGQTQVIRLTGSYQVKHLTGLHSLDFKKRTLVSSEWKKKNTRCGFIGVWMSTCHLFAVSFARETSERKSWFSHALKGLLSFGSLCLSADQINPVLWNLLERIQSMRKQKWLLPRLVSSLLNPIQ